MEAHPPRLIEDIFGALIPPACREHVLGDWHERYTSPSQYISDAIVTLPFIIVSQIRRTFRIELFLAELCAAYIAFGLASFRDGPGYLFAEGMLLPLAIMIGAVLFPLIVTEAYRDRDNESLRWMCLRVGIALASGYFVQGVLGLLDSGLKLPASLTLSGTLLAFPMLVMVRTWYARIQHGPTSITTGAAISLDQLRRRSEEEHRKAWHVNFAWLAAALLILVNLSWNPFPSGQSFGGGFIEFILVQSVIVGIFLKFGQYKQGNAGWKHRLESSSILVSRNAYRVQLVGKRDGLRLWSGAGVPWVLSGPALFLLFVLAFPFFILLIAWVLGQALPAFANTGHLWLSLVALIALLLSWLYLRRVNERAARAIQKEIDALDTSEKKQ
jgi:hypothetical protein